MGFNERDMTRRHDPAPSTTPRANADPLSHLSKAKPETEVGEVIERLRHSIATAQNDDCSAPQSDQRSRHVARIDAIEGAINMLSALTAGKAAGPGEEEDKMGTMTSGDRDAMATGDQRAEVAALIASLESATEPDRELDGKIDMFVSDVPGWCRGPTRVGQYEHPKHGVVHAPEYTRSVDAAMALIDFGDAWLPYVECERRSGDLIWEVMLGHMAYDAIGPAFSKSLPIAICIVALKARAAS